jgi:hypothetical protein
MTQIYNTAVMNVFAELGEFVLIDELFEEPKKYQEMYETINPVMEEVFRVHSCEFTYELLKQTTKERFRFYIKETGFEDEPILQSYCPTANPKKIDLISILHRNQITRHFDDYYVQNDLKKLNQVLLIINIRMKKLATLLEDPKENLKDIEKYLIREQQDHVFIMKMMNEEITKYELLR